MLEEIFQIMKEKGFSFYIYYQTDSLESYNEAVLYNNRKLTKEEYSKIERVLDK